MAAAGPLSSSPVVRAGANARVPGGSSSARAALVVAVATTFRSGVASDGSEGCAVEEREGAWGGSLTRVAVAAAMASTGRIGAGGGRPGSTAAISVGGAGEATAVGVVATAVAAAENHGSIIPGQATERRRSRGRYCVRATDAAKDGRFSPSSPRLCYWYGTAVVVGSRAAWCLLVVPWWCLGQSRASSGIGGGCDGGRLLAGPRVCGGQEIGESLH
jgi:hypothetical protein